MILLTIFSTFLSFSNEQLLLQHLFHQIDMEGTIDDMFGNETELDTNQSYIYDKRVRP